MSKKTVAIVLAGGKGKRMNMDMPKQYLEINGKPLICHTLDVFENSFIDEIIAVVGIGEISYFRNAIVEQFGYSKVKVIVEGGSERYHSVLNGLRAINDAEYVYIHDGARPCLSEEMLLRGQTSVEKNKAVVAAVKVKDTIKIAENGKIISTPDRDNLWQIQTPQIFVFNEILDAYERMIADGTRGNITDDAMVMECYGTRTVYIYEGAYENIKVTTSEDILAVENILKKIKKSVDI